MYSAAVGQIDSTQHIEDKSKSQRRQDIHDALDQSIDHNLQTDPSLTVHSIPAEGPTALRRKP